MDKSTQLAQIVAAFFHFLLVEMRPLILLWYAAYHMFEDILISEVVLDAYGSKDVVGCIYSGIISAQDVEDCAKSVYQRYLRDGPQEPYKNCSDKCPGSDMGISIDDPRNMFFFMNAWLLCMYHYLFM